MVVDIIGRFTCLDAAMADNLYRFRRLKWGDPQEKLKLLPDPPGGGKLRFSWEHIAMVVLLLAVAFMSYELVVG
ncbi:hypothetical protein [Devosia nitrariae]|uniref:Uncharacterized protein n=1 Tax=Devosia nitrariae TaxID=2071872 RepID=A0ABQ5W867_9HYPH|nr:hypothetical protein [Devosia nitrariae]GLQ55979.1 hypothetical protein GCM10010862_32380 [Devosia nitrariae]